MAWLKMQRLGVCIRPVCLQAWTHGTVLDYRHGHIADYSLCCCREEKGKGIMPPQHTAVMVEPDEAASSSSASTLHSRPHRLPAGTSQWIGLALWGHAMVWEPGCLSEEGAPGGMTRSHVSADGEVPRH